MTTEENDLIELNEPAGGVPEVLTTEQQLNDLCERVAAGSGPVAWDAERASGYRYSQRAYLVQGRREGVGTFLIDPLHLPDLSTLSDACGDAEWVLHAANQDMVCLRDVGLRPGGTLFDTELGSRLAGFERVALGTMVAELLGIALAKEHSAADWSTRPLPDAWLNYAALDVEILLELRLKVRDILIEQGKLDWAYQEFAYVADAPAPRPKLDPWRRTSGSHLIRKDFQQAMLRSLWNLRDSIARRADRAPGKVMNDRVLVAIIKANPKDLYQLKTVKGLKRSDASNYGERILQALDEARALPPKERPGKPPQSDGPPPPRSWESRKPSAHRRLEAAKDVLDELMEETNIPRENLLQPAALREVCWSPVSTTDTQALDVQFADLDARPWQRELLVPRLVTAWNAT